MLRQSFSKHLSTNGEGVIRARLTLPPVSLLHVAHRVPNITSRYLGQRRVCFPLNIKPFIGVNRQHSRVGPGCLWKKRSPRSAIWFKRTIAGAPHHGCHERSRTLNNQMMRAQSARVPPITPLQWRSAGGYTVECAQCKSLQSQCEAREDASLLALLRRNVNSLFFTCFFFAITLART